MPKVADGVGLSVLLEENLLWDQARYVGDMTEELLHATRSLLKAESHNVPISKNGYLSHERALSDPFRRRSANRMLLLYNFLRIWEGLGSCS